MINFNQPIILLNTKDSSKTVIQSNLLKLKKHLLRNFFPQNLSILRKILQTFAKVSFWRKRFLILSNLSNRYPVETFTTNQWTFTWNIFQLPALILQKTIQLKLLQVLWWSSYYLFCRWFFTFVDWYILTFTNTSGFELYSCNMIRKGNKVHIHRRPNVPTGHYEFEVSV